MRSARVQHLKISDEHVVRLVTLFFGGLGQECFRFAGSPSAYTERAGTTC